jgi:acetyl-CoA synthetase
MEQALLQYNHPVKVKLLLDGEKDGWISYSVIDKEEKEAIAADTNKDDDLFWFFTSGTTGMPKVAVHTQSSYPLGHLTTAAWIGLKPEINILIFHNQGGQSLHGVVYLLR